MLITASAPPIPPFNHLRRPTPRGPRRRRYSAATSPLIDAFSQLQPGDFLFIPATDRHPQSIAPSISRFASKHGLPYVTRQMIHEGVFGCGVWRLPR